MPSNRPIVPSDNVRTNFLGDSSSATPASGSGNTESAPGASGGRWGSGDSAASHEAPKKRRAPGAVAAIACIECRKARQKVCGIFNNAKRHCYQSVDTRKSVSTTDVWCASPV